MDSEMNLTPLTYSNKMFALRKIRKYLTCDAAVLVYKQTIMPIFDYEGFLLISLNNNDKSDLQIMQNDALRYCKGILYVFKVDTKMGTKYKKSPYYLGTILWNGLDKDTQDLPCRCAYKKKIGTLYPKYNPLI